MKKPRAKWHKMKAKSWKKPGNCLRAQLAFIVESQSTFASESATRVPMVLAHVIQKLGMLRLIASGTAVINPFMLVGTVPFH